MLSACSAGSKADVSALLEKGADVHFIAKVKRIYAQSTLHLDTLMTGDSKVVFCTQNGFTALHKAAQEGNVDVVRLLMEAKAHVNIQTEVHVHTLSNEWSTDLDSQFLSEERGESMYSGIYIHD